MLKLSHIDIFNNAKIWLENLNNIQEQEYNGAYIHIPYNMSISKSIKKIQKQEGHINVIMQFYIDNNNARQLEIQQCLFLNCNNNSIDKIYLLNERYYTDDELGIISNKIIQINIDKRLSFECIFNSIQEYNIDGYIIISNSDIFFDKSIENVKICDFENKNILALCRYEYDGFSSLKECKLFDNGRPDSQDVWILKSNINIDIKYRNIFNFNMGYPGCDNKILYLFQILGYNCYNEAQLIKTFHNHNENIRNYNNSHKLPPPYCGLFPNIDTIEPHKKLLSFNFSQEAENLSDYIQEKIANSKPFIIPRIAGIENQIAFIAILLKQNNTTLIPKNNTMNKLIATLKNNAGIKISTIPNLFKYGKMYMRAFEVSDIYLTWALWSNVARPIFDSLKFMYINIIKPKICANTLNIYNNIQGRIWTKELAGKRLLIISPFIESFKDKINIRERIYGIDLFPNCEFIFLKPPQTQGSNLSDEFDEELARFIHKIDQIKDTFDIALVSCGGYGNLVCLEIFNMHKSAIYVGGVLQMYFGVYGNRWEKECPDIMRIYKNEYWTRPSEEEKPIGHNTIENSCYW